LLETLFLFAVTPIFILLLYQDRSPEVDDIEGLTAAATEHLELLKLDMLSNKFEDLLIHK
jgi:hypothetical protein